MTTRAWRIRLTSDLERNEGQSATAGPDGGVMSVPADTAGADQQTATFPPTKREKFSHINIEVDRFDGEGVMEMARSVPFEVSRPVSACWNGWSSCL